MWVQLWTRLATDLNSDGVTANRVLFDIANELDSRDILWAAGNGSPGGAALYLMAMDSLYKVSSLSAVLDKMVQQPAWLQTPHAI